MKSMDSSRRSHLVRLQAELNQNLREELTDKFAFHFEAPYDYCRLFFGDIVGGSTFCAKAWTMVALSDYDRIVASGRGNKLNRIAHQGCGPGMCRDELQRFSHRPSNKLRAYPFAFCATKKRALMSLVGRGVEAVHSEIKRIGLVAKSLSPPMISACLQELEVGLGTRTTLLVFAPPENRKAYQCSLEDEFMDVSAQQQTREQWQAFTIHQRRVKCDPSLPWRVGFAHLRARFFTESNIFPACCVVRHCRNAREH